LKKSHVIYLLIILFLGLVLRLLFLDKPEGLWNDEYVSWMISKVPFDSGFWGYINTQNHMPLYYLYLKAFMSIFGDADIVLRVSSIIPALLAIPVMYMIGNTKNNFCAIFCAVFSAISPFLVYYSQEVRLYSLLFLFSALTLLYLLKSINNPSKINLLCFALSSALVLFTHTIGFVYIFAVLVYFLCEVKNEKVPKMLVLGVFILIALIVTPFIVKAFTLNSISQWWGKFSFTSIVYLFTDYFSPVLSNLTNSSPILTFEYSLKSLSQYLPALIAICLIIKAKNIKLSLIAVFVITSMLIASFMGKLVFTTKYSIEILPILIYLFACGVNSVRNCASKYLLIFLFFALNIFYFPPTFLLERTEGNKLATNMIGYQQFKQGDTLILSYYDKKRFEKYIDLSNLNIIEFSKSEAKNYIDDFSDKKYNKIFNNLRANISDNTKGSRIAILTLNSVSFIPENLLYQYYLDKNGSLEQYFVHSYVKNGIVKYLDTNYTKLHDYNNGSWNLKVYEK